MNTLTPAGARLLRQARDQILAHPDQFNMEAWDCGTTACIAGWMARVDPALRFSHFAVPSTPAISERCGFGNKIVTHDNGHPLTALFYDHFGDDAPAAAQRINAFLWQYGYPPDELIVDQGAVHAQDLVTPR